MKKNMFMLGMLVLNYTSFSFSAYDAANCSYDSIIAVDDIVQIDFFHEPQTNVPVYSLHSGPNSLVDTLKIAINKHGSETIQFKGNAGYVFSGWAFAEGKRFMRFVYKGGCHSPIFDCYASQGLIIYKKDYLNDVRQRTALHYDRAWFGATRTTVSPLQNISIADKVQTNLSAALLNIGNQNNLEGKTVTLTFTSKDSANSQYQTKDYVLCGKGASNPELSDILQQEDLNAGFFIYPYFSNNYNTKSYALVGSGKIDVSEQQNLVLWVGLYDNKGDYKGTFRIPGYGESNTYINNPQPYVIYTIDGSTNDFSQIKYNGVVSARNASQMSLGDVLFFTNSQDNSIYKNRIMPTCSVLVGSYASTYSLSGSQKERGEIISLNAGGNNSYLDQNNQVNYSNWVTNFNSFKKMIDGMSEGSITFKSVQNSDKTVDITATSSKGDVVAFSVGVDKNLSQKNKQLNLPIRIFMQFNKDSKWIPLQFDKNNMITLSFSGSATSGSATSGSTTGRSTTSGSATSGSATSGSTTSGSTTSGSTTSGSTTGSSNLPSDSSNNKDLTGLAKIIAENKSSIGKLANALKSAGYTQFTSQLRQDLKNTNLLTPGQINIIKRMY